MSRTRKPTVHPSEWLIPASDQRGHATMIQFRMAEDWTRRVQEIVEARTFPFKTASDVYRWCISEGVGMLSRLEPKCTDLTQTTAAERVLREAEDQQRFLSIFERTQRVIDQAIVEHDEVRARQLVADLRYQFEQMPEGPGREKYLAQLGKWDWLLTRAEPAPLTKLQQPKRKRPRPVVEEGED